VATIVSITEMANTEGPSKPPQTEPTLRAIAMPADG